MESRLSETGQSRTENGSSTGGLLSETLSDPAGLVQSAQAQLGSLLARDTSARRWSSFSPESRDRRRLLILSLLQIFFPSAPGLGAMTETYALMFADEPWEVLHEAVKRTADSHQGRLYPAVLRDRCMSVRKEWR